MRVLFVVVGIALAGCKPQGGQPCRDRVEALAMRLASPRPLDEILQGGPPALRDDLKAVMAVDGSERAVEIARRAEKAVERCPELEQVFGRVAAVESKEEYLVKETPKALLACQCKASPEHAGGLLESILTTWEAPQ